MKNKAHSQNETSWERTYNHFKEGYKNAQDSIRFVDTKTSVITGLIILATSMPFAVLKWSASLDDKYAANLQNVQTHHIVVYQIILVGCVIGIFCGVSGIAFGVEGIAPRPPKKHYNGIKGAINRYLDIIRGLHKSKDDRPPTTVLFPFYKEKDEVAAKKHFHNATKGLSERDILREYEIQVAQVGRILCIKIECNKRSVFCFEFNCGFI